MNPLVQLSLTLTETEALVYFIAERKELWARVAESFGVADPGHLPAELIAAHKNAVRRKLHPRKAA